MVIHLSFRFDREPLNFVVKEREIYYSQRKFGGGIMIRCIPPPENFMKAVALSRNRINANLINMFKFTEEEIKEYNDAKDEQALADLIIKDAKGKGCIFVKQVNETKEGVIQ
jgi:hypothetical protein